MLGQFTAMLASNIVSKIKDRLISKTSESKRRFVNMDMPAEMQQIGKEMEKIQSEVEKKLRPVLRDQFM